VSNTVVLVVPIGILELEKRAGEAIAQNGRVSVLHEGFKRMGVGTSRRRPSLWPPPDQ
jgi:hypothetical protein